MLLSLVRVRQVRTFRYGIQLMGRKATSHTSKPIGDDDLFKPKEQIAQNVEMNDIKVISVNDDFDIEAALKAEEEGLQKKTKKKMNEMDQRLATAAKAASTGRISGYSIDEETAPSAIYSVAVGKDTCPGCGVKFQSNFPARSGYVPEEIRIRLLGNNKDEIVDDDILEMEALLAEARAEKELIPWEEKEEEHVKKDDNTSYLDALLLEDGEEPERFKDIEEDKQVICQRCHALRYGSMRGDTLRATLEITGDDTCLSAEAFEILLKKTVKEARGVVILFVDLFDVDASLRGWRRMGELVGSADRKYRRVLVAANKFDLLPNDVSRIRLVEWIRKAVTNYIPALREHLGPDDVFLMSAKTGLGVHTLLNAARTDAARLKGDVYAVGAANAGKSTFINRAIGAWVGSPSKKKKLKQKKTRLIHGVTASNAPGTTLGLVRVATDNDQVLYDTPGLLTGDSLAAYLNADELKGCLPTKPLTPASLRLSPGQSILLGGFARIDFLESDYGAFFFTFCFSDGLSLHPTNLHRRSSHTEEDESVQKNEAYLDFVQAHIGTMLKPPYDYERFLALQANSTSSEITIHGQGWETAAVDVVLSGLGWFSVTGSGSCRLRIVAPRGILVTTRDPLLPFESRYSRAKFTGGKVLHPVAGGKKRKRPHRSPLNNNKKKTNKMK